MSATARGVPYPAAADANNVPADVQALATWVNDRPGVATLTTVQRDALAGAALWEGRCIYNTTTDQLEVYEGAAWVAPNPRAWQAYAFDWSGGGGAGAVPALGNGAAECRFRLAGDTCDFVISQWMGSTTTYGAQPRWSWALPFDGRTYPYLGGLTALVGRFVAKDLSDTGRFQGGDALLNFTNPGRVDVIQSGNIATDAIGPARPFAWASGDMLQIKGRYEIDV